jgi:hypothetical protein
VQEQPQCSGIGRRERAATKPVPAVAGPRPRKAAAHSSVRRAVLRRVDAGWFIGVSDGRSYKGLGIDPCPK